MVTGAGVAEYMPSVSENAMLMPYVHSSLSNYCVTCLQVLSSRLVDMERDYLTLDKRYPRLFVPSEFSKVSVFLSPNHFLILSAVVNDC